MYFWGITLTPNLREICMHSRAPGFRLGTLAGGAPANGAGFEGAGAGAAGNAGGICDDVGADGTAPGRVWTEVIDDIAVTFDIGMEAVPAMGAAESDGAFAPCVADDKASTIVDVRPFCVCKTGPVAGLSFNASS